MKERKTDATQSGPRAPTLMKLTSFSVKASLFSLIMASSIMVEALSCDHFSRRAYKRHPPTQPSASRASEGRVGVERSAELRKSGGSWRSGGQRRETKTSHHPPWA